MSAPAVPEVSSLPSLEEIPGTAVGMAKCPYCGFLSVEDADVREHWMGCPALAPHENLAVSESDVRRIAREVFLEMDVAYQKRRDE